MALQSQRRRKQARALARPPSTPQGLQLLVLSVAAVVLVLGAGVALLHSRSAARSKDGTVVQCHERDELNFKQLVTQLRGFNALVDNVELSYDGGLRGLKAKRKVSKGQAVLSVPWTATLSIATFRGRNLVGPATAVWQGAAGWETQLDTLALLYEFLVTQPPAPAWLRAYLCTLPKRYDLPLGYEGSWREEVLQREPVLAELVGRQRQQVQEFEPRMLGALQSLPGGHTLLEDQDARQSFRHQYHWAYSAAKTRTITLDISENLGPEVVLPSGLEHLTELGVLVPLLDLANHASGPQATTYFAVDMTKRSITQGRSPVFSLVAARDILPGEPITFSYLPDDDDKPRCSRHWLLEYGFMVEDGRPGRDCAHFNVSTADLSRILAAQPKLVSHSQLQPLPATASHWLRALGVSVQRLGYPNSIPVQLVAGGQLDQLKEELVQLSAWAGAAAGLQNVDTRLACAVLQTELKKLHAALDAHRTATAHIQHIGKAQRPALLSYIDSTIRAVQAGLSAVPCNPDR